MTDCCFDSYTLTHLLGTLHHNFNPRHHQCKFYIKEYIIIKLNYISPLQPPKVTINGLYQDDVCIKCKSVIRYVKAPK